MVVFECDFILEFIKKRRDCVFNKVRICFFFKFFVFKIFLIFFVVLFIVIYLKVVDLFVMLWIVVVVSLSWFDLMRFKNVVIFVVSWLL